MNLKRAVLIPILVISCFLSFNCLFPDYEKLADKITDKTAKELKEEKGLYLIGTGGRMMDDIQMMAMGFQYYQEMDVKKARELLVYTAKKYLTKINSDQKIRPYLHEYPFNVKNIEIRIWIYNTDGSKLSPDKIGIISSINGRLEYYVRSDFFNAYHEETYEEALKLVNQENDSQPTSSNTAISAL